MKVGSSKWYEKLKEESTKIDYVVLENVISSGDDFTNCIVAAEEISELQFYLLKYMRYPDTFSRYNNMNLLVEIADCTLFLNVIIKIMTKVEEYQYFLEQVDTYNPYPKDINISSVFELNLEMCNRLASLQNDITAYAHAIKYPISNQNNPDIKFIFDSDGLVYNVIQVIGYICDPRFLKMFNLSRDMVNKAMNMKIHHWNMRLKKGNWKIL